jgi:hypothetical protein
VAARLSLSVRTVEGHIYRAMMKTGVSSRDELAAFPDEVLANHVGGDTGVAQSQRQFS